MRSCHRSEAVVSRNGALQRVASRTDSEAGTGGRMVYPRAVREGDILGDGEEARCTRRWENATL